MEENFCEKDFRGANFHGLLTGATKKCRAPGPNFVEKTFVNTHKITKAFSLESFPLYGTVAISWLCKHAVVYIVVSNNVYLVWYQVFRQLFIHIARCLISGDHYVN